VAADEPAGRLAESLAYVCFGPEPDPVHRRVLSRAADRLLVLYQEHSPLPGEGDADAGG
jgi:citrate synthase